MNHWLDPIKDAELINRLENFKFTSAWMMNYSERPYPVLRIIAMLAQRYGDCGHIDGSEGTWVWTILDLLFDTKGGFLRDD